MVLELYSFKGSIVCYALLMSYRSCFSNGCHRWDQYHKVEFYSENVKAVFFALYSTVNQLGAMASAVQNRDVTKYNVESVSFMCDPLITNFITFK